MSIKDTVAAARAAAEACGADANDTDLDDIDAVAAAIILLDLRGYGGLRDLGDYREVDIRDLRAPKSLRAPWARGLGSGQWRADDGEAYRLAAVEAYVRLGEPQWRGGMVGPVDLWSPKHIPVLGHSGLSDAKRYIDRLARAVAAGHMPATNEQRSLAHAIASLDEDAIR